MLPVDTLAEIEQEIPSQLEAGGQKKRSRAAGCWRADWNSSGSTRQGQCTPMAADNNTV